MVVGRESPELCFIDYYPRINSVEYDNGCYENKPIISVAKIPGMQKWFVETKFVISWSVASDNPNLSGIPSLKIFDDGQDLQLGTSYIRGLSWELSTEVLLGDLRVIDNTEPIGLTRFCILGKPRRFNCRCNNTIPQWHRHTSRQYLR